MGVGKYLWGCGGNGDSFMGMGWGCGKFYGDGVIFFSTLDVDRRTPLRCTGKSVGGMRTCTPVFGQSGIRYCATWVVMFSAGLCMWIVEQEQIVSHIAFGSELCGVYMTDKSISA